MLNVLLSKESGRQEKREENKTREEKVLCLSQCFSVGTFGVRWSILFYKYNAEF